MSIYLLQAEGLGYTEKEIMRMLADPELGQWAAEGLGLSVAMQIKWPKFYYKKQVLTAEEIQFMLETPQLSEIWLRYKKLINHIQDRINYHLAGGINVHQD